MTLRAAGWERVRDRPSCALPLAGAGCGLFLVLASFSACSSDEGASSDRLAGAKFNHPPVVNSVALLPTPLVLTVPLTVVIDAHDPDLNTISFRYRWLVNGKVIAGQTQESFPPELLRRGDQVVVEVTPFDGLVEGALFRSIPASVVNTPPIISSVDVEFDHQVQGQRMMAKVDVVDPDQDAVSLKYRWRKNETVVKEGEDNTLDIASVTAADVMHVDVTASDGNPAGSSTVSQRFALSNSAPTIVSTPARSATGGAYEYQVKASDPDGDPITYKLEESPPGMSIGEQTGEIHWNVAPDAHGTYRIKVVAQDNRGGFAAQAFELSISAPAKAS